MQMGVCKNFRKKIPECHGNIDLIREGRVNLTKIDILNMIFLKNPLTDITVYDYFFASEIL